MLPNSSVSARTATVEPPNSTLGAVGGIVCVLLGLLIMLYGLYALGSYSTPISDDADACFFVIGVGVLCMALGIAILDPPGGSGPLPGDEP